VAAAGVPWPLTYANAALLTQSPNPHPLRDGGVAGPDQLAHWCFGPFVLDPAARELRRGTVVLKTTHKMFDLLSLLLHNRHRVVPHAELIESVWPRVHVSPGVLPQMVRKLRLVLDAGQRATGSGWIKGYRGVGYRFLGQVERVAEPPAAALPAPAAEPLPGGVVAAANRVRSGPHALPDSREQALYEQGRDQIRRDELTGLADTILALRFSDFSGGSPGHRRCLVWADIFESHLERLKGNSRNAWHHLESAHLLLEGLALPHLQCELHSQRGLYFETFTTEVEALTEFEKAWGLVQEVEDLRLRAGCAARLAFAFGRTLNWPAFETWTRRSLELAAHCGSRAIWLRHTAAAAMGWMEMGHQLTAAGAQDRARQAWSKALRLNESVLGEPAESDISDRTRRIATINRLALLARLQPHSLFDCVAGLRACLADETRPPGRIQLMHELASLLHSGGSSAEADALCTSALAACQSEGVNECRDQLLALSADIASAQGDLSRANASLRDLLVWRELQASQQAQRLAAITAVRLDTERALTLAEADRRRAEELSLENSALRRRAAMLEATTRSEGLASLARFERHLAYAWSAAQARSVPLCVAVIAIDVVATPAGRSDAPQSRPPMEDVALTMLEICRGDDVVAALPPRDTFGVVFDAVGPARAMAVCQRMRKALHASGPPGARQWSVSIAVDDVSHLATPEVAMEALRVVLAEAQRAGGNRVWGLHTQPTA